VADPLTFLNQERWRENPPAAPAAPSRPGEVRARETTDAEKREAAEGIEFMVLSKRDPGKSAREIVEMMNHVGQSV